MSKYIRHGEEELIKQHIDVQKQIEKLPKNQQDFVRETQRLVDAAMLDANEAFGIDGAGARFEQFLVTHNLPGGPAKEELLNLAKRCKPGKTFTHYGRSIYKSFRGDIMMADDYIYTLESAIISHEKGLQIPTKQLFLTLIKRLFGR